MKKLFLYCMLVTSFSWVNAEGWAAKVKRPDQMPAASSKKSVQGFSGMVAVAPKGAWEKEWNRDPDRLPALAEVRVAKVGDEFAVLTLFSNPGLDSRNHVNVICSIRVTRPDGTVAVDETDVPCYQGPVQGSATRVQLSPVIVRFVAEADDPVGIWRVEAEVKDLNRKAVLHLKTFYDYVGSGDVPG